MSARHYPRNWREISRRIRFERAKGKCEWCGAEHLKPHPVTGSKVILTVAHLDHALVDHSDENLAALCQRCHFSYDREAADKRRHARFPDNFPILCRAARAWLGWSRGELAAAADLHPRTVANIELGCYVPHDSTLEAVLAALAQAGVRFTRHGVERRP